jgi:hypothetical protein
LRPAERKSEKPPTAELQELSWLIGEWKHVNGKVRGYQVRELSARWGENSKSIQLSYRLLLPFNVEIPREKQNLSLAKQAVEHVRTKMTIGASNRGRMKSARQTTCASKVENLARCC